MTPPPPGRPSAAIRRAAMALAVVAAGLGPLIAAPAAAQKATPAGCAETTPAQDRETVLAWYAAIGEDDLDRWDDLMTPDALYGAAALADARGPEAAKAIYRDAMDAFDGLAYAPLDVAADADGVAVRFEARGVQTGEFRGVPPTGKEIAWQGIGIFRLLCGRIAEALVEVDQLDRARQLGTLADLPVTEALDGHRDLAAAPPPPATPCAPATPAEAEAVALAMEYDVWSAGEVELLPDLLAPGFGAAGNLGDDQVGLEDYAGTVEAFRAAVPDLADTVTIVIAEGDLVAYRWESTGTMTGAYLGLPPTGGRIAYTGNTMLRLECGRVAENWTEADMATLLDQMGAAWQTAP